MEPEFSQIWDRLRSAPDLPAVQEIVRKSARELTGAHGSTLVLREGDSCFYADEDAISPLWKGQRFPVAHCISGWAMIHGECAVVPDVYRDERVPAEAYRPTFVQSLAVAPIGEDDPVGAIGIYWAVRHTATEQEVAALRRLCALTDDALIRLGGTGVGVVAGPQAAASTHITRMG